MLMSRRAEVRATTTETLEYMRAAYSFTVCTLSATNRQPEAEQMAARYKKSAKALDEIRASLDIIQLADFDKLNQIERATDIVRAPFRSMKDNAEAFKQNISAEELARVNALCIAPGSQFVQADTASRRRQSLVRLWHCRRRKAVRLNSGVSFQCQFSWYPCQKSRATHHEHY